ncbi:MAG TPA: amylo-alpha-1,6-glucosidase [Vicinamibacterales bacterium]|jgi:predicted glycogen debranching enzyme|nr:amylo-alpha-1,6-glucosidase [Vicinamibacterales bacterium]
MDLIRRIERPRDREDDALSAGERPPRREWLVTNGLGGYASGTVAGMLTRRYHGMLIASLPAPFGRMVMLNHLLERVRLPGRDAIWLGDQDEVAGPNAADRTEYLKEFRLELGLPVWLYRLDGFAIEKRIVMPHGQNTVHLTYRVIEGTGAVRFTLRPSVHFRGYEAAVDESPVKTYTISSTGRQYELSAGPDLPVLRMTLVGTRGALTLDEKGATGVPYQMEETRGYQWKGSLWSPGYFRADAGPGDQVSLVASVEPWETVLALSPNDVEAAERERRRRLLVIAAVPDDDAFAGELVLAADQFVIRPAGRVEETQRAHAAGDEVRTVIAGYHWFTDWGRDTMISLEGLTLSTRRFREAGYILRTFAHYVRDGLIPNMFPDGEREGLYHTADASLWFFHAIDRYFQATGDEETLRKLLPVLIDIVEHHLRGTRFGIRIDPADGLFTQGAEGYQLTWMDAKVGDWVVTPRRGKAVELNALWYNALCVLQSWTEKYGGGETLGLADHARRARESFNRRFWYDKGGYLYDVVDTPQGADDPSCRPNQVLAISLPHPILDPARWEAVLDVVRSRLLTPVGLRSLAPGEPDYKPRYYGDLRARDAAYHQGTVWAWLIGPFIDASVKVKKSQPAEIRSLLAGFRSHLNDACVGSISEVFDAEPPFLPRGCIAQAWSVAEVLRCWMAHGTAPAVQSAEAAAARA